MCCNRRMRSYLAPGLLVAALCLSGCTGKHAPPAPPPPPISIVGSDDGRLEESLFKGDQAVLSNQDIERILAARITLADRHRLAVLRLNQWNVWYRDVADIETQNSQQFLRALSAIPQFTQVRPIPALLVPEKRTIPYLREAAARFQADLLLIYGAHAQVFQRDRLIGTDEVMADCSVQAVLLDVRTGIVLHASEAAETISAKKSPGDLNFAQTVARTEAAATGKALLKVAGSVVDFVRASEK